MREDLQQIDTSAIEQLVHIKDEEGVLHERLEKMEANKDAVSAVVYQRVKGDYETRLATLEKESQPLKDHARREYAKLRTLQLGMERGLEDARLEKEEIEFRNNLGEFERSDFAARIAAADEKLSDRQKELDEAIQLKARFLTAFRSEEELTKNVPPPAPPPRPAAPPPPPPIAPLAPPPTPEDATLNAPPAATAQGMQPPEVSPADATAVAWFNDSAPSPGRRTQASRGPAAPTIPATTTAPGEFSGTPGYAAAEATQVAPMVSVSALSSTPRLIALEGDRPAHEYVLGPGMTSIGRSPKAQIRVIEESVSRQHAQLVVGPEGCKLLDMGSENGTSINGERVSERLLADGDLIQIGSQRFLFRA